MPHYNELIPWVQITRFGMPDFIVVRRPMTIRGETIAVGSTITVDQISRPRLRQLYEQRLLNVVEGSMPERPSNLPLRKLHHQVTSGLGMSVSTTPSITEKDNESVAALEKTTSTDDFLLDLPGAEVLSAEDKEIEPEPEPEPEPVPVRSRRNSR